MRALLTIAAVLAFVTPASATLLVTSDGQPIGGRWQQWVDASRVPTPDRVLTVSFTNPDGIVNPAYFHPAEGGSVLYVPNPFAVDRLTLMHEIGHLYDYTYLSDSDRLAIMLSVLGRVRDWRQVGGNSPHEQFAETYAFEAIYPRWRSDGYKQQVDYDISDVMDGRRFRLLHEWLMNIPRLLGQR